MTILTAPRAVSAKNKNKKIYTIFEYLKREEVAVSKSEFYNGKIIRMAGASSKHNLITNNISTALRYAIKHHKLALIALNSDQKIFIENSEVVVYSEAMVISEKPEYWQNRKDLITNPLLIVEVQSKSTRGFDRGEKFIHYRTIPTFKEYVLIEQDEQKVEVWYRIKENTWEINTFIGQSTDVTFKSLGINVPMVEIYESIEFL